MTLEILEILSRLKNTMSRPLDSLDIDLKFPSFSQRLDLTESYVFVAAITAAVLRNLPT